MRKTRRNASPSELVCLDDDPCEKKTPVRKPSRRKGETANVVTGPSSNSQTSHLSMVSASKRFLKKRGIDELTPESKTEVK